MVIMRQRKLKCIVYGPIYRNQRKKYDLVNRKLLFEYVSSSIVNTFPESHCNRSMWFGLGGLQQNFHPVLLSLILVEESEIKRIFK